MRSLNEAIAQGKIAAKEHPRDDEVSLIKYAVADYLWEIWREVKDKNDGHMDDLAVLEFMQKVTE